MSVPAAITGYFDAINSDRFEALADVFADDVVIQMGPAPERSGTTDAIAFYPKALAPFPQHLDDPVDVIVSEDGRRASVEIAFTGTTADGRLVEFTAVDLFELDDAGRVVRLRSFYDTAKVKALLTAPVNDAPVNDTTVNDTTGNG
jgi:ketosteroid isomerase-like protein